MRILMVSGEYPPMQGGVADFTRIVARRLAAREHEVHVLTSQAAHGEQGSDDGVIVWPHMAAWKLLPLRRELHRLHAAHPFDVINVQYQAAAYGMRGGINTLPLWTPAPCVTTFHDLLVPYLFPKAGPLRWRATHLLASRSQAAIVTNREDRQKLVKAGVASCQQIPIGSNIEPLPLDAAKRAAIRRAWGISPAALALCYFGFLNASKGGEELIQALAHVVAAGVDARLVLIGDPLGASDATNSAYLTKVKTLIAERDLEEHITWTGRLPNAEVSAALRAADVCVLPYRDGVSFRRGSLMAALAHGMPIVSTEPQVNLPEVRDGENMLLAPSRNPQALAEAILSLAQSEPLRAKLAQGAKELASQFDWDRIATETIEVLQHVVADNRR